MIINFLEERFFSNRRKKTNVIQTLLIDLSAVFVWRGTWGLMDKYLFPTHPDLSFIVSILVGIFLIITIRQANAK